MSSVSALTMDLYVELLTSYHRVSLKLLDTYSGMTPWLRQRSLKIMCLYIVCDMATLIVVLRWRLYRGEKEVSCTDWPRTALWCIFNESQGRWDQMTVPSKWGRYSKCSLNSFSLFFCKQNVCCWRKLRRTKSPKLYSWCRRPYFCTKMTLITETPKSCLRSVLKFKKHKLFNPFFSAQYQMVHIIF